MQPYELCALLPGSITPAEIQERTKQVAGLLAEIKAEVKVTHTMGRKKLAYTIEGQTHGEYLVWLFEAEPQAVQLLSEKLRLAAAVTRHAITKLEGITIPERAQNLQDTKAGKSIAKEETEEVSREERQMRVAQTPRAVIESSEHKRDEKKASLAELDEKLDEILESDKL